MNAIVQSPNPLTQLELHCEPDASNLSLTPAQPALIDELALECDANGALVLALGNLLGLARPLAVLDMQECSLPDGSAFSVLTLDSGNWLLLPGKRATARMQDMLAQEFHTLPHNAQPGSAHAHYRDSAHTGTVFWLQPGDRCQLLIRQTLAMRLNAHLG